MFTIKDYDTVETLLSLNKHVHAWHVKAYPGIFREGSEDAFREHFQATLEKPNYYHYTAYDGAEAVGLIQAEIREIKGNAFVLPNRVVFVHIIVVHPAYRGRGVGHLLMDRVFELARSNGITRIELDHWAGNESAGSFFGGLGFKPFRHFLYIERA